ncbi:MAG: hypothetical protein NTX11_02270 [Candidatus Saccharibacteria bacterium]|nr:hypothetical protein [Candidatus Saccharibacteria bacterium]
MIISRNKHSKGTTIVRAMMAVFMVIGVISALPFGTASAAGSASLSLTPASGSYPISTNFTVGVFENSGTDTAVGVDAKITYDATKLDFVSVDTTGGVFTDCPSAPVGGGGNVTITCVKFGFSFTGSQKIGNVTFKTKAGTGTTSLGFGSSSAIVKNDGSTNLWNGSTAGGTYTLTTPTPPPSGGGGGTTTPPPSGGGGGTTKPPAGGSTSPNTTAPANTAPNTNPGTTKPNNSSSTNTVTTSPANELVPVAPPNATGKSVSVFVSDANSRAVAGAKVSLGSKTYLTDANGIASFGDVKPGTYTVKIVAATGSASKSFTVTPVSQDGTAQKVEVVVKKSSNLVMLGALGLGAIFVLTGAYMIFRKWQMNRMMSLPSGAESAVVVNKPPEAIPFEPIPVSPPVESAKTDEPTPAEAPKADPKPEPTPLVEEKEPEIDEGAAAELLKKAHVTESAEAPKEEAPAKTDEPTPAEAPKAKPAETSAEAPKTPKPKPVVSAETSPIDAPKPAGKVDTVMVTPAEPKPKPE